MRALIAALAITVWADCATANWLFDESEDAFNGNKYTAVTLDAAGYGLGFKCTKADDLSVVFVTPERADEKVLTGMAAFPIQLLTIIDSAPRVELDARVDESQATRTYMFESDADGVLAFAKAASIAKKRIAVAVSSSLLDKPIHSKTFGIRNITRALQRLSQACNLP